MKTSKLGITFAALLVLTGILCASLDPNNPTGRTGLILIDAPGHLGRIADPVRFHELSSLPLGAPLHDVAMTPDHKTEYVPIYGHDVSNLQREHFTAGRGSETLSFF